MFLRSDLFRAECGVWAERATWHPFYSPAHKQRQHRGTCGERRGCVGGKDKRGESGGETALQYVDRQYNSWEINTHQ